VEHASCGRSLRITDVSEIDASMREALKAARTHVDG